MAFLNSFRQYNPEIPLQLVPFNDEASKLRSLAEVYGFSVFDEASVLARCDRLATRFNGWVAGHYRKLACWEGRFEEFIYIDVDTVLLDNVDFVFRYLADREFLTSHSNISEIVHHVWRDTIRQTGQLSAEQIDFATNTGFIASKRTALSIAEAEDRADLAFKLVEHMALNCVEQPFLNYLMVTSGKRYSSLHVIAMHDIRTGRIDPGMRVERWAGGNGGMLRGGRIHWSAERWPPLLVHWAGEWSHAEGGPPPHVLRANSDSPSELPPFSLPGALVSLPSSARTEVARFRTSSDQGRASSRYRRRSFTAIEP